MDILKKICRICNEEKVLNDFNTSLKTKDGHFRECKACLSKRYFEKKALTPKKVKPVLEVPPGEKQCSRCKQTLSYSNFNKNKDNVDGYSSKCKQCYNNTYVVNKEYHNANALLRYYNQRGIVPDDIELIQAKADKSNYNNHVFDKQQLTDLQISRLEKKRQEWKAIFAERIPDVEQLMKDLEADPANGLKTQLKFYEEVRVKWKLKYKNNDRFERQFIGYAKGESNVRW
jgi:hypothetical protein